MELKDITGGGGIDPVLAEIQEHLQNHPYKWLTRLQSNPAELAKLDAEIHQAFANLADKMVAGLKVAAAVASGKK